MHRPAVWSCWWSLRHCVQKSSWGFKGLWLDKTWGSNYNSWSEKFWLDFLCFLVRTGDRFELPCSSYSWRNFSDQSRGVWQQEMSYRKIAGETAASKLHWLSSVGWQRCSHWKLTWPLLDLWGKSWCWTCATGAECAALLRDSSRGFCRAPAHSELRGSSVNGPCVSWWWRIRKLLTLTSALWKTEKREKMFALFLETEICSLKPRLVYYQTCFRSIEPGIGNSLVKGLQKQVGKLNLDFVGSWCSQCWATCAVQT